MDLNGRGCKNEVNMILLDAKIWRYVVLGKKCIFSGQGNFSERIIGVSFLPVGGTSYVVRARHMRYSDR